MHLTRPASVFSLSAPPDSPRAAPSSCDPLQYAMLGAPLQYARKEDPERLALLARLQDVMLAASQARVCHACPCTLGLLEP
jgi:hypothetical protein